MLMLRKTCLTILLKILYSHIINLSSLFLIKMKNSIHRLPYCVHPIHPPPILVITFRNSVLKHCISILRSFRFDNDCVSRNDPAYETKKDDCFRRASYLAKVNSKGNTPKGQRELFSSRIPKQ